jgi:5'-hydroxyaverantin dehydrogenase
MVDPATATMATAISFSDSLDTSNLKDRSVLITGAASGIGLACAIKMAEAGAIVTMADLQDTAGAAIEELRARGLRAQFVQCDVTSYEAQASMFQSAIQFGNGQIDVVVPNAGILAEKNVFDMVPATLPNPGDAPPPPPSFACLSVNLHAVYNTCYLALHHFRLPRRAATTFKPSIVLIASLAAYIGYPYSTTYSMSKFGVRGLFYSLRERAMHSSIRINLVAPWFVDTAITKQADFLQDNGAVLGIVGYAAMDRVVDAVMRFSSIQDLCGRSVGIFPRGSEDVHDDLEGGYGGAVVGKHMHEIKEVVAQETQKQAQNGA